MAESVTELATLTGGRLAPSDDYCSTWAGKGTHNFAEGEPITSAPTVGRDLGKRRSAQRFLVVPW
jgi:hypothetical protein